VSGIREITVGCADRHNGMILSKRLILSKMHSNSHIYCCCKYGGWSQFTPSPVRLNVIRSLAYFSPVIDEVLTPPASPEYFQYLRQRVAARSSVQ
jgi:hypothetical protein